MITENQLKINEHIINNSKPRQELFDLFNKIMDYRDESETMLDTFVRYAEEFDLDVLDIADEIKKDKQFIDILEVELLKNKQISFKNKDDNILPSIDEWL